MCFNVSSFTFQSWLCYTEHRRKKEKLKGQTIRAGVFCVTEQMQTERESRGFCVLTSQSYHVIHGGGGGKGWNRVTQQLRSSLRELHVNHFWYFRLNTFQSQNQPLKASEVELRWWIKSRKTLMHFSIFIW